MTTLALTIPGLVALQLWLTGPGRHHLRKDGRFGTMHAWPGSAAARFVRMLDLPGHITDITIRLPAGEVPRMTITRMLSNEELDALSDWYVTEGLNRFPTGETTYTLEPRERPEVQS
jgi:hypothetical protein